MKDFHHGMHGKHGKEGSREGAKARRDEMGGMVRELLELRGMVG
jgi:hypothetical protein